MDATKRHFIKGVVSVLISIPSVMHAKSYLYAAVATDSQAILKRIGDDSYLIDGWVLTGSDITNFKD